MVNLRSDPDPQLTIRLFGPVEVVLDGHSAATFSSRRTAWLLAVLAMRSGQPIARHLLAGMLWPDSSEAGALHNLRQTLVGLRKSLGQAGDLIKTAPPRSLVLEPSPAVWIDVLDFDSGVEDGSMESLKHAIQHYRGPFLDGCEEPFAIEERDLRERRYVEALERIASHHLLLDDHRGAIEYLRRALAAAPYSESVSRSLMTCLAKAGEAAAALETYRSLRRRLRTDLRAEPDSQTTQLYRAIRLNAWQTVDARPTSSIPTPLNAFLGRRKEIQEVKALLERCRLVTLTGAAGVGKTRLGIAVGDMLRSVFLDGVRFVDLAPVQDASTIPFAIAAALEVQEQSGRTMLETLAAALSELEILIVLDNCEHLTGPIAEMIDQLVAASPRLHFLATSRHSLGVVGELVWRVPSLQTPEAGRRGNVNSPARREYLLQTDSVRLFLERSPAREIEPSAAELETIGSICRQLDGIPLAIELAASRMNVLSAVQIESRLKDSFSLLARGNSNQPRHSTMRAAIQWSWDMLPETERSLLMTLSVFRGGCSLEAIEAVLSNDPSSLDLVASLVDRSLLNTRGQGQFFMLESIRQFAEERLVESGEAMAAMDKHRDYYLDWAEKGISNLYGPQENQWFSRLENEHDNLRAAFDHCHRQPDKEEALRLSEALSRFWDTHGHLNEGRIRLEQTLALVSDQPVTSLLAGVLAHAGWMAMLQHDCVAAINHYEKALIYLRREGDDRSTAKVLMCLGGANLYAGDFEAPKAQFEEALAIFRKN